MLLLREDMPFMIYEPTFWKCIIHANDATAMTHSKYAVHLRRFYNGTSTNGLVCEWIHLVVARAFLQFSNSSCFLWSSSKYWLDGGMLLVRFCQSENSVGIINTISAMIQRIQFRWKFSTKIEWFCNAFRIVASFDSQSHSRKFISNNNSNGRQPTK